MKVKGRGSADGERSFGPAYSADTRWLVKRKIRVFYELNLEMVDRIEERPAIGPTAFAAAASIGWSLGECISIEPMKEAK